MADDYQGGELELFADATRWKAYWLRHVTPHVRGAVLEVGAGIGANTRAMAPAVSASSWTCLEPDPRLLARLRADLADLVSPEVRALSGTLADVEGERFDAILYIDVLEHIEDDRAEVARAAQALRPGGHLVVLAPAHPGLFSEFDRSIGHHRRYTRSSLGALTPARLQVVRQSYLDAAGVLASLANRVLLRQSLPTRRQIRAWDRFLVPASRLLDPLLLHRVGKSVLSVWQRER